MLGIVIVLQLLYNVVVKLLEMANQGQGDLLILVGIGIKLLDLLQHLAHLGACGARVLFVAFRLVLLHGDQLIRAVGNGGRRGIGEGAVEKFRMDALIGIHRLSGLEAISAGGPPGVAGGRVERLLVARAHGALR